MKTNDYKPVKSGEEKRASRKSSRSGFHTCMDESLVFRTTMIRDKNIVILPRTLMSFIQCSQHSIETFPRNHYAMKEERFE